MCYELIHLNPFLIHGLFLGAHCRHRLPRPSEGIHSVVPSKPLEVGSPPLGVWAAIMRLPLDPLAACFISGH